MEITVKNKQSESDVKATYSWWIFFKLAERVQILS
jgi:hypothetical protein